MKQILAYSGLFLTFAATMSAARYLDDYSLTYQQCAKQCAKQWQVSINMASDKPYLSEHLIEYLEESKLTINGKACPKLLPEHDQFVRRSLEQNL